MKTLPAKDEMYRALCERDTRYDGAFVAAITTTGISAAAIAWAISAPIVPAPTTAALKTNMR